MARRLVLGLKNTNLSMSEQQLHQDTICAVSTAPGIGGIAVVRISGPNAIAICDKIFVPFNKCVDLQTAKAYSAHYGQIIHKNEVLDEVVITVFHAPHSFTGEDSVEISCHGSIYIQREILQLLIRNGCRLAMPGEYTQRAFLNGKMDLSQAEAVADVISSQSAGQHRLAMSQMRGGFSDKLNSLRERLLHFVSLVELELDFSEEDVEFADRSELRNLASEIEKLIAHLEESFRVGNAIKQGIPVAIIGETNAGKSTLLNLLVGEEKAIVSDIHGTTRDAIEDTININGIIFRFIDTAGIRDTKDTIERLGIEKTFEKMHQAAIVLWVIDLTTPPSAIEELAQKIVTECADKHLILLFNKCDLLPAEELSSRQSLLADVKADRLYISAKHQLHTDELKQLLLSAAALPDLSDNDVIITNARHYEALTHAHEAILRVLDGLNQNLSGDLLSQDIRECLHFLGEITGEITSEDVLSNIFKHFCIGK